LWTPSPVVDNGLLIFNSTSPSAIRGFNAIISGTGNIEVKGPGLVQAVGANSYTGWTLIDASATFQPCIGNEGQLVSSVITNNGTLKFVRQDFWPAVFGYTNNIVGTGMVWKDGNNQNPGQVTLAGTNTYMHWTPIQS
jgi:fibronectin-binding autotransporter adhesin